MGHQFDFTSIIDRRGKDATAIDGIGKRVWGSEPEAAMPGFDEIPMWVADMNFPTCPAITQAMEERTKHPLFGYFMPREEYYSSIIDWQIKTHAYQGLTREQIGYENGVHGGIMSAIHDLTEPGDALLLHSPVYVGFREDLKDSHRKAVYSPLKKDEAGIWRMDFEDMDRKITENNIKLVLFCSPQNPTGRVWERWELEKAMEIFKKHDCTVISDEIWSDIVYPGHTHIPTSMVSEDAKMRTISMYAPSKTFNLAGLIGSYHIIFNPELRKKITDYSKETRYNEMNVLSMYALIGAYSKNGREWKDELLKVLEENCRYAVDFINNQLPGCEASMPQGTYMVFMDCSEYLRSTGRTLDDVLKAGWNVGVAYQDGRAFLGESSIRINCALPLTRVQEAFERLKKYVFKV